MPNVSVSASEDGWVAEGNGCRNATPRLCGSGRKLKKCCMTRLDALTPLRGAMSSPAERPHDLKLELDARSMHGAVIGPRQPRRIKGLGSHRVNPVFVSAPVLRDVRALLTPNCSPDRLRRFVARRLRGLACRGSRGQRGAYARHRNVCWCERTTWLGGRCDFYCGSKSAANPTCDQPRCASRSTPAASPCSTNGTTGDEPRG